MKKLNFAYWFVLILIFTGWKPALSQERTWETVVADVLNEMPANDQDHLSVLMADLAGTGQAGLNRLITMLQPPEQGVDDSKVRYALGSLAYYLSATDNQASESKWFTRTIVEYLRNDLTAEVKSFLIGLLQISGTSYASAELANLAEDQALADPAVRALVGLGTEAAEEHLIRVLKTKDINVRTAVVQGLGDLKSKDAASSIRKVHQKSKNPGLTRACLYALSNIPDRASENLLKSSAEAVKFSYDPTNATGSYLNYIDRLGETGDPEEAVKLSRDLVDQCTRPENMQSKIAGLYLLVKYGKEEIFPDLLLAMNHPKKQFRAAALKLALNFQGASYTEAWLEKLENSNAIITDEILSMLGALNDPVAYERIIAESDHSDPVVRMAALVAAGKINPEKTLDVIVRKLQSTDEDLTELAEIVRWLKTDITANTLFKNYQTFQPGGKVMVLNYVAEKHSPQYWNLVFSETKNKNAAISDMAFECLPLVSGPDHLQDVLALLQVDGASSNISFVQEAAVVALRDYQPGDEGLAMIKTAMDRSDSSRRHIFLPIFQGVGSAKALHIVYQEFLNGTSDQKESAFSALSDWKTADVLPILFLICKSDSSYHDRGFSIYVDRLVSFGLPDEQNRLLLQNMLDLAYMPEQTKHIIQTLGQVRTFQSMMLVAPFIQDPVMEQVAARSLVNIILPSGDYQGLTGQYASEYILQVKNIIQGEESDYEKARIDQYLTDMPENDPGFVSIFNGYDLQGWKGLVGNPVSRARMTEQELAVAQAKADSSLGENWTVRDGTIIFYGDGQNLVSVRDYGNFEMLVDWKITKNGDSGIYLRGTPQVQIWDTSRRDAGAQVGSGGLYNNQDHRSVPLMVADNPIGDWNTFRIKMEGERVTVYLNGYLVVDNEILENYWERGKPIYPSGPVELQAHGTNLAFRNIYIHELPDAIENVLTPEEIADGFVQLFNGNNLDGWTGNTTDYTVENGEIVIYPGRGGHGNLFTEKEYGDFILRFDFQLTPGANNGLGIRAPLEGNAAYVGMELQILDNTADIYKDLKEYQYHGSVYGVIPAKRGYLKPVGEWNVQEVKAEGPRIKVKLNGEVILDGNIRDASKDGTIDGNDHPGLLRERGHIGFLGHGSIVRFRNIRIKDLDE